MAMDQKIKTIISPVVLLASFIIIVAGMMAAQAIILPVLLALFITVISAQPIAWLEKRKLPHVLAVFIVLFVILLTLVLLGGLIGTSLAQFSVDVLLGVDHGALFPRFALDPAK